jgi:ankyrin repeat protein
MLITDLLKSLRPADMDARLSDIALPYENTFEWIWTAEGVGFVSWLQSAGPLYWISGKPGSGKSTIMKYLFRHDQTRQLLESSGSCGKLTLLSFFFHNRGSRNQKSLEGLLRSLLYQILSSNQELLDMVVDASLHHLRARRSRWLRRELKKTFTWVMAHSSTKISICLFLDALDEYDGDPESAASFLHSIAAVPNDSKTRVKVCFSSRLHNIFIDEFGKVPGFKIHEHTKDDIERVIDGRMSVSQSINDILALGDAQARRQFEDVKRELVRRAEGVFLWLKFALDNVLRTHREGGTMAHVLQLVSSLPDELDQFYELIIMNVPPQHRRETYVMLETVLRYDRELKAKEFSGVIACSNITTLKGTSKELPFPTSVDVAEPQLARRLRSRCGGLLELETRVGKPKWNSSLGKHGWSGDEHDSSGDQPDSSGDEPDSSGDEPESIVRFMHQTVKEFVSRPGFRRLVLPKDHTLPLENGHSFLSVYGLCRLYHATNRSIEFYNFLNHTTEVELTTGRSQKKMLDEIPPSHFSGGCNSLMSFAVSRNLRLFVLEALEISGNEIVNQNPGQSLLHYAVERETHRSANRSESGDLLDMVAILLKAGADVKAICYGRTPFQAYFERLGNIIPFKRVEDVTRTVQYFLEIGGQDPNEEIYGGRKALHISSGDLTHVLVRFGADVNARDRLGRTPLTAIVEQFILQFHKNYYARLGEAYETVACLLSHGGRFTKAMVREGFRPSRDGKRLICTLEYFAEVVEEGGYDRSIIQSELSRLQN